MNELLTHHNQQTNSKAIIGSCGTKFWKRCAIFFWMWERIRLVLLLLLVCDCTLAEMHQATEYQLPLDVCGNACNHLTINLL
jgi:hypothetical protein